MGELKLYQIEVREVGPIMSYAYLRTYYIYAHSEAEAMADADKILAKWSEEFDLLSMQRLCVKEIQPHRHVMLTGQTANPLIGFNGVTIFERKSYGK